MVDKKLQRAMDAFAYEPDRSLRDLIGKDTVLSDIFTKEKIENCQKLVDEAKKSFFDTSQKDMDTITSLIAKKEFATNYLELCNLLFQPINNIKGQAELFGYSLIARVCKYLIEYCEESKSNKNMSAKDVFVVGKLVEALVRAFNEKIIDSGGVLEKELMTVVEMARKA